MEQMTGGASNPAGARAIGEASIPRGARLAGLDYGEKRIGVSVSDELLLTARALAVIKRENGALKAPIKRLGELADEYNIACFVIGYPKNMNNTAGKIAQEAEKFGERLYKELKIPVKLWDERLTSAMAERSMLEADLSRKKRKERIDGVAAALILQSYLDFLAVNAPQRSI